MKKRISKLLVMMLSITMIAMPLYSYGSSGSKDLNVDQKSTSGLGGEQPLTKASASSMTSMSAATLYEGDCGDNVKYRFDSSGTLTIYGNGEMDDYDSGGRPWIGWKNNINQIVVQNGVTNIGKQAFYVCLKLENVILPNGLKSIGDKAFCLCSDLKKVSIPGSVTSIGAGAFKDTSITSISIPNGVTRIENNTFSGCDALINISMPNSIKSIEDCAFSRCIKLKSISIPEGVANIGPLAFYECDELTNVSIPNSVTNIGIKAFWYCTHLTSITIPNRLTNIDSVVFAGCSSLANITIPDSVTSIADAAFSNCSKLNKVFYSGSEEQWQSINIGSSNECLLNADIDFSGESIEPEDPDNGGDLGELDPEEPDNGEIDPEAPEDPDNGEIDPEDPEDPDVGQEDGSYDLSNAGIEVDDAVYTGSPRTPEVVVYDSDGEVIEPDNYNLIFENNINAGMATVTAVADNDAYTGSVSETFEIEKRSISNAQIKGVSGKTYSGRSLNPNPTVKVSGRTLKRGRDYTISYKNNNKLGAAKATIKGRGNYTDSVTKSFLIKPAKASIVQLKNKHKQMTVSAREQRGATWYQVRYQTKGDSGKTVKSAKRTIVVKSLKSGKLYTVQVRVCKTVNGKSYWGAYSRTMKVRVK